MNNNGEWLLFAAGPVNHEINAAQPRLKTKVFEKQPLARRRVHKMEKQPSVALLFLANWLFDRAKAFANGSGPCGQLVGGRYRGAPRPS